MHCGTNAHANTVANLDAERWANGISDTHAIPIPNGAAKRASRGAPNSHTDVCAHRTPHRSAITQPNPNSNGVSSCSTIGRAHADANARHVCWVLRWTWIQRRVLLLR